MMHKTWLGVSEHFLCPLLAAFCLLGGLACSGGKGSNGGTADASHALFWDASPPSTLLPAGASTLAFAVNTNTPASCRYSVGADMAYGAMTPFDTGQGTMAHGVTIHGLNPSTLVVNDVYVRCDAQPDQVLHLLYRALPTANASFPRKGNLWGSWEVQKSGGLEHCKRMDLWLGAFFSQAEITTLRGLNPDVLVLSSINTVEHTDSENLGIPDSYWLRDTKGNRIEVWPNGCYRLNITKPEVAAFQAQFAYQKMLNAGLAHDGMFFDNFFTSTSWVTTDVWGNAVEIDANEDGQADDPTWLDAAWKAGVFAEIQAWRKLMPYAYASGHLPDPPAADFGALFNGDSVGIVTAGVKDGSKPFAGLWETYMGWWDLGRTPVITMVEGSPNNEIAYGYGYAVSTNIPASTLVYAQEEYPYMRFALGLTLMNDGYFAFEFGDIWHGNDWWYDELDADLGVPSGSASRVEVGSTPTTDGILDGGFETGLSPNWTSTITSSAGCAATFVQDTALHAEGSASCRIDVSNAGQKTYWQIALVQSGRQVTQGLLYDLKFWAKADAAHPLTALMQKGGSDWRNYGLFKALSLGTDWKEYTITFEANETVSDGRLALCVGAATGSVWIDNVRLVQHPPDVYRRDFSKGTVILNASRSRQTVTLTGGPYKRLSGTQAPKYQYVVDDSDAAFSGGYTAASYDSGTWKAAGPWFHDWGTGCHESSALNATAQWVLGLQANDTYTLDAWWPAAPTAPTWSQQVRYEVLSGSTVLASVTLDQTQGGDQWNRIAELPLTVAAGAKVRITNLEAKPAIADAILVRSASRYNDGSAASSVVLEARDAILLVKP